MHPGGAGPFSRDRQAARLAEEERVRKQEEFKEATQRILDEQQAAIKVGC